MGSPKGFGADRRPRQPVPNLEVSERPRLGAFLRKQKLGFRNDREAPSFALRRCAQGGTLCSTVWATREWEADRRRQRRSAQPDQLSACSSPRLRRGGVSLVQALEKGHGRAPPSCGPGWSGFAAGPTGLPGLPRRSCLHVGQRRQACAGRAIPLRSIRPGPCYPGLADGQGFRRAFRVPATLAQRRQT